MCLSSGQGGKEVAVESSLSLGLSVPVRAEGLVCCCWGGEAGRERERKRGERVRERVCVGACLEFTSGRTTLIPLVGGVVRAPAELAVCQSQPKLLSQPMVMRPVLTTGHKQQKPGEPCERQGAALLLVRRMCGYKRTALLGGVS